MDAAAHCDSDRVKALMAQIPSGDRQLAARIHFLGIWATWWVNGPVAASSRMGDVDLRAPWWSAVERSGLTYLSTLRDLIAGEIATDTWNPANPLAIELDLSAGLPACEALINGQSGRFIVDTGAPSTLLTRTFADRAALATGLNGRVAFDGGGIPLTVYPAIAHQVSIAGSVVQGAVIDVADLPATFPYDGVLSPQSMWRRQRLLLDGPGRTLTVGAMVDSHELPWSGDITWVEGVPHVFARMSGKWLAMLVDTGAGANLITEETADELGMEEHERGTTFRSPTAAGHATIRRGRRLAAAVGSAPEEEMEFAVKRMTRPEAQVFPSPLQGYLGQTWFRQRRVLFDADCRSLRFSSAVSVP
jgi:hypothetical protein